MWLCSVSHGSQDIGTIGTADWSRRHFEMAQRLAHAALWGVGDPLQERAFRMNITFCIHRAANEVEQRKLALQNWGDAPGGLAGGPVEVLWSQGIPHRPAAMPCTNPEHVVIDRKRPDLWVPGDCGECDPCKARAAIAERPRGVCSGATTSRTRE